MDTPTPFINPTTFPAAKFANLGVILNLLLPLAMLIGVGFFFIMIIRAAFTVLTGEGKPENMAKAQKILLFAFLGLIVVLISFAFIKLLGVLFNIPLPL